LKAKNNITHLYFILPDGKCFLRTHKPEQFGDTINRYTFKKAAETGKSFQGIEMGKNFFSLRSVHSVIHNGTSIGYMELGEEIDHLFEKIREITGDDVSLFLTDEFMKEKSVEAKVETSGSFGLLYATNKEAALSLAGRMNLSQGLSSMVTQLVDYNGVKYITGIGPVKDAAGKTAGVMLFMSDITGLYNATLRDTGLIIAVFGIVIVLTGVCLYASMGRSISALNEAVAVSKRLSEGDLTMDISVSSRDEVGQLLQTMKNMVAKLREIVTDVKRSADSVAVGSQELSLSAAQLSQGATDQASSVEEVSSSVEQMSSNIRQNADNALQTEKIADRSALDAAEGGKSVAETTNAMKEIAGKISIIEEIARQTNLLALNAAIEAARAGEHGKGFAVVASEVRKLAERSQTAAAEISKLSISSVDVAEKAGEMLKKIVPDIQKTADLVQEISSACNEQSTGANQINTAIQQLDQVIQRNASASEEMASTSEELQSQAAQLQNTIAFFRIDGGTAIAGAGMAPASHVWIKAGKRAQAPPSAHGASRMIEGARPSGAAARALPIQKDTGMFARGVALDLAKDGKGDGEMPDEEFESY